MLQAKILLIETLRAMSKEFLDHNLFHDPNVTTIHRDYPDNRAKDVRNSILCPGIPLDTLYLLLATCYLLLATELVN